MAFVVIRLIQMPQQPPTRQQPPASMSTLLQSYIALTNPEIEQALHKAPFHTTLYAAKIGCYKPRQ